MLYRLLYRLNMRVIFIYIYIFVCVWGGGVYICGSVGGGVWVCVGLFVII